MCHCSTSGFRKWVSWCLHHDTWASSPWTLLIVLVFLFSHWKPRSIYCCCCGCWIHFEDRHWPGANLIVHGHHGHVIILLFHDCLFCCHWILDILPSLWNSVMSFCRHSFGVSIVRRIFQITLIYFIHALLSHNVQAVWCGNHILLLCCHIVGICCCHSGHPIPDLSTPSGKVPSRSLRNQSHLFAMLIVFVTMNHGLGQLSTHSPTLSFDQGMSPLSAHFLFPWISWFLFCQVFWLPDILQCNQIWKYHLPSKPRAPIPW